MYWRFYFSGNLNWEYIKKTNDVFYDDYINDTRFRSDDYANTRSVSITDSID